MFCWDVLLGCSVGVFFWDVHLSLVFNPYPVEATGFKQEPQKKLINTGLTESPWRLGERI